ENERIDDEDTTVFAPDIPSWHNNGILDDEDVNNDGSLDMEDLNCDGILNRPLNEDVNGNGHLDAGEDLNGNSQLDFVLNEDANGNGALDGGEDLNGDGKMNLPHTEVTLNMDYDGNGSIEGTTIVNEDIDDNNVLDHEDINCNGIWDFEDANGNGVVDITEPATGPFTMADINYLWAATDWLNDNWTFDPLTQRSYSSTNMQRHIFTFVDADGDMAVDGGEQVDFVSQNPVPVVSLTDTSTLYPYLTLFPTFTDEPTQVDTIRLSGAFDAFLQVQTRREINFIRGQDQDAITLGTFTLPAMRNRKYDTGQKIWRLGDIVHSTPTVVGTPAEGYHLLYRDQTYASFLQMYQKRRSVVYVGGNDGMVHAFNGGFFNNITKGFESSIPEPFIDEDGNNVYSPGETFNDWDGSGGHTTTTAWDLGSEIWAYVPYNLLPHLYWLTEQDYPHVYYMDMKPKIFDAKIFVDSSGNEIDGDHPSGWGTVMAIGMRLGGGQIQADMNKNDGSSFLAGTDRTMRSAIVLFDITNPEKPPRVLGEIALDGMGYTNCYPAVIPMQSKTGSGATLTFADNEWYLIFGSGPAEADGSPGTGNSLNNATSEQAGKIFILDLKALAVDGEVRTVNTLSTLTTVATKTVDPTLDWHFQEFEANSFISQPVTVDYDLDFNADSAYFGSVIGDFTGWGGKLRRIVFDDEPDYSQWHDLLDIDGDAVGDISRTDNVMIDLSAANLATPDQPIVAPVSIALDSETTFAGDRVRWIFFGTGRFYVREDAPNIDQQSYYGLKEPSDANGFTWGEIAPVNLLDVSNAQVFGDKTVENVTGVTDWDGLLHNIDFTSSGWRMDFSGTGERNLGGAALLGELLTFTSYLPSQDICDIEGRSNLYALYFKTGTSYYRPVIGWAWDDSRGTETGKIEAAEQNMLKSTSLGLGLAESPNIHTGREEGSKAFVQTSTGAIVGVEQLNPGRTKSGKSAWR
ncbi:MAG: hypothetical protein GY934_16250, partial [Gammaproteobacteria bacterium]|nr:hypothetical protein [Gammaproteobacteria bacterium]